MRRPGFSGHTRSCWAVIIIALCCAIRRSVKVGILPQSGGIGYILSIYV
jgi:hypothetical protein